MYICRNKNRKIMKAKQFTHELKYNSMSTGKMYFNITEARKEQKRL